MKRFLRPAAAPAAAALLAAVVFAAVLVIAPGPAGAAGLCGMRQAVADSLAESHGEVPVSWGLIGSGHMVEVFVSPDGGFTILITRPDGLACVLAAGEHWQDLDSAPAHDPA